MGRGEGITYQNEMPCGLPCSVQFYTVLNKFQGHRDSVGGGEGGRERVGGVVLGSEGGNTYQNEMPCDLPCSVQFYINSERISKGRENQWVGEGGREEEGRERGTERVGGLVLGREGGITYQNEMPCGLPCSVQFYTILNKFHT